MHPTDLLRRVRVQEDVESGALHLELLESYLNYSHADDLKQTLRELVQNALDAGTRRFVVDLSHVSVMDSCGLSVLIGLRKQIDAHEGSVALASMSPMIRRLFSITRLDRVFEIYDDASDATLHR